MRAHSKRQFGQATTEYALIVLLICAMLLAPVNGRNGFGFMGEAIDAYKTYYTSFYYVLNLPFP